MGLARDSDEVIVRSVSQSASRAIDAAPDITNVTHTWYFGTCDIH